MEYIITEDELEYIIENPIYRDIVLSTQTMILEYIEDNYSNMEGYDEIRQSAEKFLKSFPVAYEEIEEDENNPSITTEGKKIDLTCTNAALYKDRAVINSKFNRSEQIGEEESIYLDMARLRHEYSHMFSKIMTDDGDFDKFSELYFIEESFADIFDEQVINHWYNKYGTLPLLSDEFAKEKAKENFVGKSFYDIESILGRTMMFLAGKDAKQLQYYYTFKDKEAFSNELGDMLGTEVEYIATMREGRRLGGLSKEPTNLEKKYLDKLVGDTPIEITEENKIFFERNNYLQKILSYNEWAAKNKIEENVDIDKIKEKVAEYNSAEEKTYAHIATRSAVNKMLGKYLYNNIPEEISTILPFKDGKIDIKNNILEFEKYCNDVCGEIGYKIDVQTMQNIFNEIILSNNLDRYQETYKSIKEEFGDETPCEVQYKYAQYIEEQCINGKLTIEEYIEKYNNIPNFVSIVYEKLCPVAANKFLNNIDVKELSVDNIKEYIEWSKNIEKYIENKGMDLSSNFTNPSQFNLSLANAVIGKYVPDKENSKLITPSIAYLFSKSNTDSTMWRSAANEVIDIVNLETSFIDEKVDIKDRDTVQFFIDMTECTNEQFKNLIIGGVFRGMSGELDNTYRQDDNKDIYGEIRQQLSNKAKQRVDLTYINSFGAIEPEFANAYMKLILEGNDNYVWEKINDAIINQEQPCKNLEQINALKNVAKYNSDINDALIGVTTKAIMNNTDYKELPDAVQKISKRIGKVFGEEDNENLLVCSDAVKEKVSDEMLLTIARSDNQTTDQYINNITLIDQISTMDKEVYNKEFMKKCREAGVVSDFKIETECLNQVTKNLGSDNEVNNIEYVIANERNGFKKIAILNNSIPVNCFDLNNNSILDNNDIGMNDISEQEKQKIEAVQSSKEHNMLNILWSKFVKREEQHKRVNSTVLSKDENEYLVYNQYENGLSKIVRISENARGKLKLISSTDVKTQKVGLSEEKMPQKTYKQGLVDEDYAEKVANMQLHRNDSKDIVPEISNDKISEYGE